MRTRQYLTCVILLVACLNPKIAFAEDPVYVAGNNVKKEIEKGLGVSGPRLGLARYIGRSGK